MRTGHAGQAIDHGGMDDLMPAAVATGDARALELRILACYRLKTAVPAASLAAMGAVAGGGSEAQITCVGDFFEALGLAFQIIDDVLNLRGFKGDLKTRGEDVMNGLVTLPVARALSKLDEGEREALWATLRSKPKDRDVIEGVIAKLESVGAIESCAAQARELVETAWQRCEPLLEPSLPKVMLRAFGWFVLERHY
jgi:geranylgeranyl pyrophosphate synthase